MGVWQAAEIIPDAQNLPFIACADFACAHGLSSNLFICAPPSVNFCLMLTEGASNVSASSTFSNSGFVFGLAFVSSFMKFAKEIHQGIFHTSTCVLSSPLRQISKSLIFVGMEKDLIQNQIFRSMIAVLIGSHLF